MVNRERSTVSAQAIDFIHDAISFQRFGMRDVHRTGAPRFPLRQFFHQRGWRQVLAALGEFLLLATESRFDDQHGNIHVVQALPQSWVGAGIAAEGPPSFTAAQRVADGGHCVYGRQYFHGDASGFKLLTGVYWRIANEGGMAAGQAAEVWPNDAVEDVLLQGRDGVR